VSIVKELMNLEGRRALVTGANGGLGKVMADTLAELGADLILVDHPDSDLNELSRAIQLSHGVKVEYQYCDLEIQNDRSQLIKWVNDSGELHVLVNNAAFVGTSGLHGWSVPFEEQSIETWRRAIEVNLTAVFELCQGLSPMLRDVKGSTIVNIASIYGQYAPDWSLYEGTGMSNPAAYNASKGGVIQLNRYLATTLAPHVRVNAISPGGIFRNQPDKFVKRYEAKTPLARMASEDDFRGAIAYLASDLSSYVTGQNLSVDGGWGVW
jgi:NAD(P)-dependent dehydrogenase (short-subunit alcohol dehydrogenase family)